MKITINDKQVNIKKVGGGTFSKIYKGEDGRIYAIIPTKYETEKEDFSREAIAHYADGTHVPEIECHGDMWLYPYGDCYVYSMPEYYALAGEAKEIAKKIVKIYRKVSGTTEFFATCRRDWNQAAYMIFQAISDSGEFSEEIVESIDSILSAVQNYGDYMLEFPIRNMKQDSNGNLIFLDIAFNPAALRRF